MPLIKCFCGCSELTEDEVKRIYRLNAQETLINQQASKLLRKYLETQWKGDRSEAERMLDIYEKTEEYLRDFRLLTIDEVEELGQLGLIFHMEKELKACVCTGDNSNIKRCLLRIQSECRNKIEASKEYAQFKEAILNKLTPVNRR